MSRAINSGYAGNRNEAARADETGVAEQRIAEQYAMNHPEEVRKAGRPGDYIGLSPMGVVLEGVSCLTNGEAIKAIRSAGRKERFYPVRIPFNTADMAQSKTGGEDGPK
jgi:hypothetical protein